jgi:hypothetical protein
MKKTALAFFVIITWCLYSCSNTHILSSWRTNNAGKQYRYMLVFATGKSNDAVFQQNLENHMTGYLKKQNVRAIAAHELFEVKKSKPANEAEVLKIANKNGFDGLMIINLIDKKEEQNYGPGFTEHTWNSEERWNLHTPVINYRPSDETDLGVATNFILKVKLYDVAANTIKYTAEATTYDAGSSESSNGDFSKIVVKDLKRKDIVSK